MHVILVLYSTVHCTGQSDRGDASQSQLTNSALKPDHPFLSTVRIARAHQMVSLFLMLAGCSALLFFGLCVPQKPGWAVEPETCYGT